MTALEVIHSLQEKKRPAPNWTDTQGVYADYSSYPNLEFYAKCPKCGLVHGSYKNMREAHGKRLCDHCNVEAINKTKKMVKEVDAPKNQGKPGKGLSKVFNEADETLPEPPDDAFDAREYLLTTPSHANWIQAALTDLAEFADTQMSIAPRSRAFLDADKSPDKVELEGDDGTEWTIWKTEDVARAETLEHVRNMLETEPELFAQDWLQQFIDQDRLRHHLHDEARDIEWLLDRSEQEQVDFLIKENVLNKEDFYNEEDDFVDNEDLREAGLEAYREQKAAEFDPMEWFREIYGAEAAKYAIEAVGIDIEAAAQSAIDEDGWVHFASSYDGNSIDLQSGAVAIRSN